VVQGPLTPLRLGIGALLALAALSLVLVARHSRAERAAEGGEYQPIRLEEGNAPRHIPAAIFDPAPAGTQLVQFQVEGPCCNGCSVALYDAALTAAGVERAAVRFDEEAGMARGEVWLRDDANAAELAAAVTFDKYTGRIVQPTP
jgi:hypothetical protein